MYSISDKQRILSAKRKESEHEMKEVSVLSNSSSSSTVSDGRSRNLRIGRGCWKGVRDGPRIKASPAELTRLRFRAKAILELLYSGCASEASIRAALGDSPETSKALRM